MRLSTTMIFDQQTRNITNSQTSWLNAGNQMATGKRVVNPSDDPLASAQAVVLAQSQAETSQYKLARQFATQNVSLEDSVLDNVGTAITGAQSALIGASKGSLSDDDRASYATQLSGIRDQLLNLANTSDGNGRYIFAGYKSDAEPYVKDSAGNVTYNGGSNSIQQKVDASRTMITNHTGNQIFNSVTSNAEKEPDGSASETDVFAMLNSAINALNTPVSDADETSKNTVTAAVDKSIRGLRNSLNNVLAVRSELGTQLDELGKLDALGSEREVQQSSQMSNLVDADLTSTISNYLLTKQTLTASYKAFQDMSTMSLFQLHL